MEKNYSKDVVARTSEKSKPTESDAVREAPMQESTYRKMTSLHIPSDISDTLKPPLLPDNDGNTISYEDAHLGVVVHIPGSIKMCCGDEIRFYWGKNLSTTTLFHRVGEDSIIRVLCISYDLVSYILYGQVDVYYELYRDQRLIGTSPVLKVNIEHAMPANSKARQRQRFIDNGLADK
ncbi:Uncharacterized protein ABJ99_2193 [Pseudomonas syringae pv. cilantro]|uniref:Uncharacterized protein n=2 Tax=Pseudomonas syringae group TaxID=136849 RepID=A0A0N0XCL8_PSESX|nr:MULTISPECIES: hypothetical protein [Pseudomonas syringae group]KPC33335.1 Uncharacterized protein ABJ99_2193 [Pseudomonas syringae pv. cilantro]KPW74894.1 Uncharacterized protein ALO76_01254 [Pseudomonas syringae pv. coriandricola]RMN13183.1 hypothetical protein ALQ65_00327 [Pseudomonas syringae pv. coriandricola]